MRWSLEDCAASQHILCDGIHMLRQREAIPQQTGTVDRCFSFLVDVLEFRKVSYEIFSSIFSAYWVAVLMYGEFRFQDECLILW
jgi:hypothetical protein